VKRQTLAAIGAAGLLVVFVGATWLYQGWKAAEVESAGARNGAPPFVREHSPVLGSDDAEVSIVEFFDPG